MASTTFRLINNDGGPQTLRSRAGDVFTLGAFVYPKTGNTGGGNIILQLVCSSSVSGGPAATTVTAATIATPATGSWTYITGTAIVPSGYDTVDAQLVLSSVPATDQINVDDVLVREVSAAQNILDKLYQSVTGTGTTNNSLASLGTQFSTWISNLFGGTSIQSAITASAVPNLSASKITSGSFAQSMVTGLSTFITNLATAGGATGASPLIADLQTMIDNLNKVATGSASTGNAASTFLTNLQSWMTNLFGTNTLQTTLTAGAVPNLSASKITSGSFAQSMVTGLTTFITNLATAGGATGSGSPLIADLQTVIDNLNKVATGSASTGNAASTFLTNLQSWMTNLFGTNTLQTALTASAVPNLNASKITAGNLLAAVLPTVIPSANIPAINSDLSPNLAFDPDFELAVLWTGAAGSQSTLVAHSGTTSRALLGSG